MSSRWANSSDTVRLDFPGWSQFSKVACIHTHTRTYLPTQMAQKRWPKPLFSLYKCCHNFDKEKQFPLETKADNDTGRERKTKPSTWLDQGFTSTARTTVLPDQETGGEPGSGRARRSLYGWTPEPEDLGYQLKINVYQNLVGENNYSQRLCGTALKEQSVNLSAPSPAGQFVQAFTETQDFTLTSLLSASNRSDFLSHYFLSPMKREASSPSLGYRIFILYLVLSVLPNTPNFQTKACAGLSSHIV